MLSGEVELVLQTLFWVFMLQAYMFELSPCGIFYGSKLDAFGLK